MTSGHEPLKKNILDITINPMMTFLTIPGQPTLGSLTTYTNSFKIKFYNTFGIDMKSIMEEDPLSSVLHQHC